MELISWYYEDSLAGHFGFNKIWELIAWKYYWLSFWKDVKAYVKGCNICLASKTIRHKLYSDLQSLLILTHQWKDLSIDFVAVLPILIKCKGENYDSIPVIVNCLIKMFNYKPIKVMIDAPRLAKVILDLVVQYQRLFDLIVTDRSSFFIWKFW